MTIASSVTLEVKIGISPLLLVLAAAFSADRFCPCAEYSLLHML